MWYVEKNYYKITIVNELFNARFCPKWSVLFIDNNLIKTVFWEVERRGPF